MCRNFEDILLAEDLPASSDIPKNGACLRVMSDKSVVAARYSSTYHFNTKLYSIAP